MIKKLRNASNWEQEEEIIDEQKIANKPFFHKLYCNLSCSLSLSKLNSRCLYGRNRLTSAVQWLSSLTETHLSGAFATFHARIITYPVTETSSSFQDAKPWNSTIQSVLRYRVYIFDGASSTHGDVGDYFTIRKMLNSIFNILSRDRVIIDGVWIGNLIYWTLTYPWQVIITVSLIQILYSSLEHTSKSSQTVRVFTSH
jgi:hypothetical protein